MKLLSVKEQLFADSVLGGQIPTEAGRIAGYAESVCCSQCPSWVSEVGVPGNKKHLLAYINDKRALREVVNDCDAADLLRQLQAARNADVLDIMDEAGVFKPLKDWPLIWRQMVDGIEVKQLFAGKGQNRQHIGNIHKIKFMKTSDAFKMFGEHVNIGGFRKEDVNINVNVSIDRLLAGRERARLSHDDAIDLAPDDYKHVATPGSKPIEENHRLNRGREANAI